MIRALMVLMLGFSLAHTSLALATDFPIYGGLGGNQFRAECPKGSYLVGLAGRTGAWVDRIAPVCAPWLRGSQAFGAPTIGQSFGMSGGGQERQVACIGGGNNTRAIQSWWIHVLRSDNHYVQFIQMYCDSVPTPLPSTNEGPRLDFGTYPNDVEEMVTGGPFGSQPPFQACPAGEVAVGFRVRAGQFLDAIGLICGPVPARVGAPATKVDPRIMMPRADLFEIIKPSAGDTIPHGQLIILAVPPKIGSTDVADIELRYLDAPANQRHSYPFTTVFSVTKVQLLDGYPVPERVTGGYVGRWQIRARSSMKTPPGPWSFPKQFQMVKASPPPPPMVQMPKPNAPIMQPSPVPQTAPLPSSSIMQAPAPSSATTQMRRSSSMIMPRGVDEKGGEQRNEAVDTMPEREKRP